LEPSGTAQWYAARVAVNKELAVARRFPGAYVPTWTTRTGTAGLRPLIPGYTFFHCQPGQLFAAGHIPGVIGWLTEIGYTSRPAAIPDSQIEELKYAVSRDARPAEEKLFDINQKVRIMTGPLTGHDAVVTGRGKGYVTVGYTLFNRSLSTRFDPLEVVAL
jgi:transcription antitermination factor NusG